MNGPTLEDAPLPVTTDGAKANANANANDACKPDPPAALPGTDPIDKGLKDDKGRPIQFDCFGGCGASCELQDKKADSVEACQDSACGDGGPMHRVVTYDRIAGATHRFCGWHDSCYLACEERFEIDAPDRYTKCTRWCDFGCVSPDNWDRSRVAGDYDPTLLGRTALGGVVFQLTGTDEERKLWIDATKKIGPTPVARSWADKDCIAWASTALGSNGVADRGSSEGTKTFTRISKKGEWAPGTCHAAVPTMPTTP